MVALTGSVLQEKLDEAVQRLRSALAPRAIYLFVSLAYGRPSAASDLDLLVVLDDSPLTATQRDAIAYRALSGIGVPADVLVYTQQEFDQRSNLPVSLERTVKERGRVLYAL